MFKDSEAERVTRYQSVIKMLEANDSFHTFEIHKLLKNEKKRFINRIINELIEDGYITKTGLKTDPLYFWSKKRKKFNQKQWINYHILTATVKQSPPHDRPRERLLRLGAPQLKTSELFAILIRSGLEGESALRAGEKLSALWGHDIENMSLQTKGELKSISKAIGEAAYCQIMAALELGKRLADQMANNPTSHNRIQDTTEAITYCRQHFMRLAREAKREEFHVVLLDDRYRVIKSEQITAGLLNESLAHPREVFRPAIRESAWALILVHNHPNGDPTPSPDDKLTTARLEKAAKTLGLQILDHIIVTKDKIFSMAEKRIF